MIKKVITTALFAATLTACKSTPPADVSLMDTPSVRYKLPLDRAIDIRFNTYNRCVNSGSSGCGKYDNIKLAQGKDSILVERRVHNGIAGSGAVFSIDKKTERTEKATIVTYQPVKMSSYHEGLLFSFGIPKLDITNYLSQSQFKTKFEVDSDYSSQSVKANFDRLMQKASRDFRIYEENTNSKLDLEDYYMVDLDGAQVVMLIETFPYRDGSKVVVNAVVQSKETGSGLVDVSAILKSVEEKVSQVVKS
ncbi:hypothetical protein [Shewanella pneumatophori]|uniref:Lipoprotein n=1 Tax=Shewanella pneumatophori TaxID=314092 RepID=A0A9X2CIF5_9GAMM|nr:hypothetical protein [Shewanella pneumatophori]MCL1139384.1 hypothetical protein [Shewanella pneumatophori]